MKRWPVSLILLLAFALARAENLPAGTASTQAAITIEADSMELNQRTGTTNYKGNVVLVRGGLKIKADSITLFTKDNTLQRAVADGNPVRLEQAGSEAYTAMHAESEHMEYRPLSETIELKGKALLWRDGNQFTGQNIRYDLKKQTVKATGGGEENGRVRVLLQPQTEPEKSGEQK